MARYKRFTFLCDQHERQAIAILALHLQRTQSDTIRYLVLNATRELAVKNKLPLINHEEKKHNHINN